MEIKITHTKTSNTKETPSSKRLQRTFRHLLTFSYPYDADFKNIATIAVKTNPGITKSPLDIPLPPPLPPPQQILPLSFNKGKTPKPNTGGTRNNVSIAGAT